MFPSSGLFAGINCPFLKRGLCARPHCLYKHAAELRDVFGASCQSSMVDFAGEQNGYPLNDETKDDSFQELERINKEIETVRYEVEQEQRRLSRYQTVLADSIKTPPNFPVSKSETGGKNVDRGPHGLSSCTDLPRTYSRGKKYVVDNSRPRTDLEYDPLSNFSAGLRSYSSSAKEQKVKQNGKCLKRAEKAVPCDVAVAYQFPISRSPSPEPLDDSNEDCDLIIDIPLSPKKKRARAQTPVDFVAGKSLQEKSEVKTKPVSLLNVDACEEATLPASTLEQNRVNSNYSAENNQGPFNLYENKECENAPVDVVHLTGYLEDVQTESQKITHSNAEQLVEKSPEPASPLATTDQQDHNCNTLLAKKEVNVFHVELPQCELPHCVGKMNPLQPHHFPPNDSLFYEAPGANSYSPCRQHAEQVRAAEPPAQNRVSNQWSSVLPQSQKTSSKMQKGPFQGKAAAPEGYLVPAEPASVDSSALSLSNSAESSSASTGQLFLTEDNEEVILISSSSDEDELNYSEMELSDSDPMEECYRIFMEANEEKGNEEQPDASVGAMDVEEKPKLNVKPQALPGRKRVAHDAKHTEPVAKSRPQPQVLVPLRAPAVSGFASQPSNTSKIQQVQHRASMLTASVKGGQAFVVSSSCQRKPETQNASLPSIETPENMQLAPVQNAHMNYISLGTAVIGADNNLHLILPEGIFPLPITSTCSQVTSVLTPFSQVHTSSVAVRQMYHTPALTPLQRYRTTAPVLIPAPARKPSLTSALSHSSPAASTIPQAAVHTTVKPVPTKRKLKQCEAAKEKVPHEIRQRYVNMFTEEFLKTTANVNEAFEKALAEEKAVYNRSVNKLKYLSVAVNALKRLKNQSAVTVKDENEVKSQRSKGNISLNLKKFKGNDDMALYESLKDYILTEESLVESNYPLQHPEKPGCVVLFVDHKKGSADPLKRICCRCGSTYSVNQMGKHIRKEECNYHYGKGVTNKVPGGVETRYSCCEGVMGAPGCQVFQVHVHDYLSLDGFVSTVPRHPSDTSCPGIYSLDCEMCYTIHGLELSRVTVVNSSLQVVYDTFVRPDNEAIDYNTRFSGVGEEDVKGNRTSLREVQETLLSFVSADTILIGHGLETDLCALKLLHGTVIDTSVVFPHRLGPPHKLTLNNLTAEYLRRIIQESVCGHDTEEDAAACMELMLWRLKEDGKMKK
ncbi:RNA exonuclease 1 homolog isoform X2 [Anarrhichthys ocellatus]|uniref:RNA exonuclease 1 homolog isoform X2 n=1 Tax=Anarrhichthys ocellatus TaxID=433405 RepID=UPI0012ED3D5F|nr:RNA exonuclease 1 homolog isoform X2 [Anarrhichthys ocellatus]